jgi:hypothetical protein
VVRPLASVVLAVVALAVVPHYWHVSNHVRLIAGLVLLVPSGLLLATRTWRWRSHALHITNQRLIRESGAVGHHVDSYAWSSILDIAVDQTWRERMARRGHVYVVTTDHERVDLGEIRHPKAFVRVAWHHHEVPSTTAPFSIGEVFTPRPETDAHDREEF